MEDTMRIRSFALLLFLWPRVALATDGGPAPDGYGLLLVKMVLILAGVCLLAWVSLRWGLKRWIAPDRGANGAMEVLGRLPLEPRRSLLVVRVATRHLVLSSSENGVATLAELTDDDVAAFAREAPTPRSFADVLAGFSSKNVSRETPTPEES
jgi:flagellar biosynthetic protein FliO